MDRKRALEIMGLHEDASKEVIVKRYNVLFKKLRQQNAENLGYTRDELDEAYRVLMGIEYRDPEAERRKQLRRQHPNPVLKALGIDYDKLSNFLYYNAWKIIVGILAVIFVVWIITSITNRVEPDFKVIVAGNIYVGDIDAFEESLKEVAGVQEPQAQYIPISDGMDPSLEPVYEEKLAVEITAGENDVFILDMNLYDRLARFGVFVPLDDMLDELGPAQYDERLVVAAESDDGEEQTPRQYGVDVTKSSILKEEGITGDSLIAVMAVNGKNSGNAVKYIKALVESSVNQ
jgi:hypothetical protein